MHKSTCVSCLWTIVIHCDSNHDGEILVYASRMSVLLACFLEKWNASLQEYTIDTSSTIDYCDDDVKLYCDVPADSASSLAEPVFPLTRRRNGTQCFCSVAYYTAIGSQGRMSQIGLRCYANEYHASTVAWTTVETAATETETQPSVSCACDQSSGGESSCAGAGAFTGILHSVIS